jgi:hypothetical protein
MRENFIKFGSFLSLDSTKRTINMYLWHYFGTALINDVGMNCLGSEGIIISVRDDAYKFIIDKTVEMAGGKRSKQEIFCISGDVFFNQQTIHSWGCSNAKFITDYWCLFEKGLKDNFGLMYFKLIYDELKGMANAFNENIFNEYYHQAMTILKNNMPTCQEM